MLATGVNRIRPVTTALAVRTRPVLAAVLRRRRRSRRRATVGEIGCAKHQDEFQRRHLAALPVGQYEWNSRSTITQIAQMPPTCPGLLVVVAVAWPRSSNAAMIEFMSDASLKLQTGLRLYVQLTAARGRRL